MNSKEESPVIRIGVSACLLGEKVRYDGSHKRNRFISDVLDDYVTLLPVCPEADVGMSVPREAVQLEGDPQAPRMIGCETGDDWTARVRRYARKQMRQLEKLNLSGFILKKDSPSCGRERVKVFDKQGKAERKGRGLFAAELITRLPLLPVEEEGRLSDARLRDNFIVRIFAYDRLRDLFRSGYKRDMLLQFHARHKCLLLVHSKKHCELLEQLLADLRQCRPAETRERYGSLFMATLNMRSTTRKNVRVLHHILGLLKGKIEPPEKREILSAISAYGKELTPLIVPLTLLRHHVSHHKIEHLRTQVYLNPDPRELMLRYHA